MIIEELRDKLNSLVDEVLNGTTAVSNAYDESIRIISNYIHDSVSEDKKDVANTAVSDFLKLVIEYKCF